MQPTDLLAVGCWHSRPLTIHRYILTPWYIHAMRPAVETPISPELSDPRISGDLTAVERAATPAPASGAGYFSLDKFELTADRSAAIARAAGQATQRELAGLVLSYLPWACPWPDHNCHDDFASCRCTVA